MTELEKLGALGVNRVSATLRRFGSIRRSSGQLGVSHTSLRRWMMANRIPKPLLSAEEKRVLRNEKAQNRERAALLMWIKENPGVVLPRKTSEVARITRVSPNQVKTYLYRRRRIAKDMMRVIIRLASRLPLPLVDIEEKALTSYAAREIYFLYDHWSLVVNMKIKDALGTTHIVKVPDLEYLYGVVLEAASLSGLTPNKAESS